SAAKPKSSVSRPPGPPSAPTKPFATTSRPATSPSHEARKCPRGEDDRGCSHRHHPQRRHLEDRHIDPTQARRPNDKLSARADPARDHARRSTHDRGPAMSRAKDLSELTGDIWGPPMSELRETRDPLEIDRDLDELRTRLDTAPGTGVAPEGWRADLYG